MKPSIEDKFGVGKVYFVLGYYDANLLFPFVESYVYLGENLFDDDAASGANGYYFQDAKSYSQCGENLARTFEGVRILRQEEEDLEAMFSSQQLANSLANYRLGNNGNNGVRLS
jgi:hypothetical protein